MILQNNTICTKVLLTIHIHHVVFNLGRPTLSEWINFVWFFNFWVNFLAFKKVQFYHQWFTGFNGPCESQFRNKCNFYAMTGFGGYSTTEPEVFAQGLHRSASVSVWGWGSKMSEVFKVRRNHRKEVDLSVYSDCKSEPTVNYNVTHDYNASIYLLTGLSECI